MKCFSAFGKWRIETRTALIDVERQLETLAVDLLIDMFKGVTLLKLVALTMDMFRFEEKVPAFAKSRKGANSVGMTREQKAKGDTPAVDNPQRASVVSVSFLFDFPAPSTGGFK